MKQDLKNRLKRIHGTTKAPAPRSPAKSPELNLASWPGWTIEGHQTLKRRIFLDLPSPAGREGPLDSPWPQALAILVPDLFALGRIPEPEELLFFDLETTGLSGGAGTIAFLAAFGRFAQGRLELTQYLLLDYPGEPDFVDLVLKEFGPPLDSDLAMPLLVTYNGKSFDAQILKTRCLMNGLRFPDFFHADLLHPARRLWKAVLHNCSQGTIETSLLGLDRTGDRSGAEAPDIWFSFLKTGENGDLLDICLHNEKDILGLACLFLAMTQIAGAPLEDPYPYDAAGPAFAYRRALCLHRDFFAPGLSGPSLDEEAQLLLEKAARSGSRRPEALKVLAIEAEWKHKDLAQALEYSQMALALPELGDQMRENFERREQRLRAKIPPVKP
ncbi:MAG: ribonuclease H-like domain-containing protein [Treponema sp.]|nr:ribonuclease H-like domain-containing protein [Treponema sp.]